MRNLSGSVKGTYRATTLVFEARRVRTRWHKPALRSPGLGFTLIELLIVIGIVLILAALAIPNLLEAQSRARYARVKAELRTVATGIELYRVDNNGPPLDWSVKRGDPQAEGMIASTSGVLFPGRVDSDGNVHAGLTTPVAYISNCWMTDPYLTGASYGEIPFDQQKYTYNWFYEPALRGVPLIPKYVNGKYAEFYGEYRIGASGPDRSMDNGFVPFETAMSRIYDPTNGPISVGNIWRSQREPVLTRRPVADTLIDP